MINDYIHSQSSLSTLLTFNAVFIIMILCRNFSGWEWGVHLSYKNCYRLSHRLVLTKERINVLLKDYKYEPVITLKMFHQMKRDLFYMRRIQHANLESHIPRGKIILVNVIARVLVPKCLCSVSINGLITAIAYRSVKFKTGPVDQEILA